MFCGGCGSQLPDDSKFCGSCGAKVAAAPITEVKAAPEPVKEERSAPAPTIVEDDVDVEAEADLEALRLQRMMDRRAAEKYEKARRGKLRVLMNKMHWQSMKLGPVNT